MLNEAWATSTNTCKTLEIFIKARQDRDWTLVCLMCLIIHHSWTGMFETRDSDTWPVVAFLISMSYSGQSQQTVLSDRISWMSETAKDHCNSLVLFTLFNLWPYLYYSHSITLCTTIVDGHPVVSGKLPVWGIWTIEGSAWTTLAIFKPLSAWHSNL